MRPLEGAGARGPGKTGRERRRDGEIASSAIAADRPHSPRVRVTHHDTHLRVRYADTDAMGVVYYANYLAYFEAARVEFLRALGVDYRALEEQGIAAPVVEATCRYLRPARFDDLLAVRTRLAELKRASFVFEYQVIREADQAVLAQGCTSHACVNRATLRPVRIPEELLRRLSASSQPT